MVEDLENEVWKMISDNSDLITKRNKVYVSNLGRVKVVFTSGKSKLRKPHEKPDGYLCVHIRLNGKGGLYSVHRLVATAFCVKPKSDERLEVNHLNENRADNRAENLEWCTHRQNLNYGHRDKLLHNFGNIRWKKKHEQENQACPIPSLKSLERAS